MNLADKTLISVLAKSGEAVLLLLSSIVMVRYLTREEYGTFLQVMLIMNTALMFTYFGMPQSIYYYHHKTNNKASFVVRNIVISFVLGGIAALAVFSLGSYMVRWFTNPLLHKSLYALVALIFLRGPLVMRDPLLISNGNLILNSLAAVLSNALFYIPAIIAAFFSMGLFFLLKVLLVASLVDLLCFLGLMVWFVTHLRREESRQRPLPECRVIGLREQLRYALPIGASSYVGIVGRQIDQYIVSMFFSPQSFAVYSRGAMRVPVLSSIQYTINDIMMPYYVKAYRDGDIEGLLRRFHLCVEKVAKINFPVFVFLFLASPTLITFLYTDQYLGAVPVFRTYLVLLVINITTFGIIPRATGQTKSILYASLINIVANIILSCLLVPLLGAVGAAIATILCAVVSGYYYLFISARILGIGVREIFPWRFLAAFFAISLLAGVPLVGLNYLLESSAVPLIVQLSLGGLLYGLGWIVLVTRFGMLSSEDLTTLSRWLRVDARVLFQRLAFLR